MASEIPTEIREALESGAINHSPHNILRPHEWRGVADRLFLYGRGSYDDSKPPAKRPIDVLNRMILYIPNSGVPSEEIPGYEKLETIRPLI